jgi:nucleosome binding factor SPN SPT16 subunit
MVIVFKDFNRNPQHINTIPVESLDAVKDWLDSVEIPYSEGPLNLQWPTIMKTVQADPHAFFEDGGWSFLAENSDSDKEGDSEDEESAFEISGSELEASEPSSNEESDFDENASAEASDEEISGEDTEGEDWDELEKKAKKQDKNSVHDDEEKKVPSRPRKR